MSVCDRLIDIEEEPFRTHFYSRIHNSTPNINPHPTLNSYLNTIQKTKLIFDLFKRHRFLALLTKDFGVRDLWLFFSRFCYRCLLAIISELSTSYNELLQRFKFVNPWNTCIEYIFVLFSRKKIAFAFILRSILGWYFCGDLSRVIQSQSNDTDVFMEMTELKGMGTWTWNTCFQFHVEKERDLNFAFIWMWSCRSVWLRLWWMLARGCAKENLTLNWETRRLLRRPSAISPPFWRGELLWNTV